MFGLIRRLSHSVIPRPDRPWEDDPTSNAPHKARKRRLSVSEQEDADFNRQANATYPVGRGQSASKRARGESVASSSPGVDEFGSWSVPQQQPSHEKDHIQDPAAEQAPETQDVKEVTQGVKEVELEEKEKKIETEGDEAKVPADADVNPESIPLPDEDEEGELDEEPTGGPEAEDSASTKPAEATKAASVAADSEEQATTAENSSRPRAQ
ncbi:hypothetical protein AX17_001636 [Amanita inopinata Kibby_2008]|nr:hypothetical protein AX17_001636 [Amanita inopinata Kibby_2008]